MPVRRTIAGMTLAATLAVGLAPLAADNTARQFASHALALRAAGVAAEKSAEDVLAAIPGAGTMGDVAPSVLWSPFFSNAIVKLGRLSSPTPAALYYNPLLDVAVLTLWERWGDGYRVSAVRALPGERLSNARAEPALLPSWLSASDGLVTTLASTTVARLDAFRSAHPAAAVEPGRDAATFAAAAADMRAVLPRLVWNTVQRSRWTDQALPWLGRTAAAVEKALDTRDAAAIRSAAPDTDEETAAALVELPQGFAKGLVLDMVIEARGEADRLLIGSMLEDGDVYVLAQCRLERNACTLRRFALLSLME